MQWKPSRSERTAPTLADVFLIGLMAPPGPGRDLGTVRRIRFVDGEALPPETMDDGLNFPDGIGILE